MIKNLPRKMIIYPVLLVMATDGLFTLLGQLENYWVNSHLVNESSPLGFGLLRIHPFAFAIFFIGYLVVVALLLGNLPVFPTFVTALSLYLGHAYGSSTWIYPLYLKLGLPPVDFISWYLTVGYFILLSLTTTIIIFHYSR